MYTLYIGNKNYSSWSLRPWLLMRELSIPFVEKLTPFAEFTTSQTFRDFSPTGKVPCLHDDDQIIWDSLAITEYLAERHDRVWPKSTQARAWARCAVAEMHAGFAALRQQCSMNCGVRIRLHEVSQSLRSDVARIEELWQQGLERFGGPFLAGGKFTAVDAFFAPVAFRFQTYQLQLHALSAQYCQQLFSLPSLVEWEAAALQEPWREAQHERDSLAGGSLVEDRRVAAV